MLNPVLLLAVLPEGKKKKRSEAMSKAREFVPFKENYCAFYTVNTGQSKTTGICCIYLFFQSSRMKCE